MVDLQICRNLVLDISVTVLHNMHRFDSLLSCPEQVSFRGDSFSFYTHNSMYPFDVIDLTCHIQ